ncbi:MAG: hypothetical protein GVY18_14575 [Bacteroidetes bacterium]|jgi:hypothetical protein|nr:hypothetical protein [Bacteroidota bacterium]
MDFYTVVIILTLLGFLLLAALLLVPVYLFLKREERASQRWTKDVLARRSQRETSSNGASDGAGASAGRSPSTDA